MKLKDFRNTTQELKPFSKVKVNGEVCRLIVKSNYSVLVQEFNDKMIGTPLHTTLLDFNEIKSLEIVLDGNQNWRFKPNSW